VLPDVRKVPTMMRLALAVGLALLAVCGIAAPASAQNSTPIAPWNGENPFNCTLQNVGTGTEFPDPDADPFCVEFDKTQQNVLPNAGIVDFLSKEPARVAAAAPKCFYFQRDHWTGSVIQGGQPELWHWDGNYFFDKAKGIGGVNVSNYRIGGRPADFKPYAPPAYRPYLSPGGGGVILLAGEQSPFSFDPNCAKRADQGIYREPQFARCISPGGKLGGRRVGRARLGMSRQRVHSELGPPDSTKRGIDRWCVIGDASLRIAYRRKRGEPRKRGGPKGVAMIRTTSRGHVTRGIGVASRKARARRRLDLRHRFKVKRVHVMEARRRHGRRLFAGVRGRHVRFLAMTDPKRLRTIGATARALRRAR
jgi:hypothetical protein